MPPSALPRAARLSLAAGAVLVLLGVVEVASRGGLGHSSGDTTSHTYTSYALTIFLIVFFAAAPFAIYAFVVQQREVLPGQRKSFPRRVLENIAGVVIFLLAIYLIYRIRAGHGFFRRAAEAIHASGSRLPHPGPDGTAATAVQPRFEWPALWIAVVLAAVAGTLTVRRRRRTAPSARELPATVAGDLVATIGDAIDDLEAEPDARRAVIAAYARMEGVLARHGAERVVSETPLEYLGRILAGLHARPEPVERLTALFEQAKFSRRDIDAAMKRQAIDSLRAIRDDLTAGAG